MQEVSDDGVVFALLLDVLVQLLVRLLHVVQTSGLSTDVTSANLGAAGTHDGALVKPLVLLEADVQDLSAMLYEALVKVKSRLTQKL